MKKQFYPILLAIGFIIFTQMCYAQEQKFTLSGYVIEKGSKEQLVGVNIYIPAIQNGAVTNNYGFYSISLPANKTYKLYISYVGYQTIEKDIELTKDVNLNIELEGTIDLSEVVISASRKERLSKMSQMSRIDVPIMNIKDIPSLLGEKDVLKTLQLMPGIQSGTEGNSGIYVRGGGPDQNLIILDDAPVYNANHLFGFFSIFNGDALKSVSLTKGGFPARYGGRLSSVLEMNMKDGNKEKLSGDAGIGLISSRLTLEGPLVKNKSSFIISGRRTYIDLLAKPFMPKEEQGGYYFYDLTAKANYDFGRKNKLYLSGYFGRDNFYAKDNDTEYNEKFDNGLNWGNATGTIRWNHLFNNKIFSNTSLIFSDYKFSIYSKEIFKDSKFEMKYNSGIKDIGLKYDMQYHISPSYFIRTGFSSTYHRFKPSAIVVKDDLIDQDEKKVNTINTYESGIYIENEISLWNKLRVNAGLRLSYYHHDNKEYFKPEPRLSASYSFTDDFSMKASYANMNQYVHLLSSSGISLPLDLWVPTTDKVKPQASEQVAIGFVKDFNDQNFSVSLEGYYKKMNNIVGYKPGANFLLLEEDIQDAAIDEFVWEDLLMRGKGWSYGTELLIQRKFGKLSGWLGYTLSWTEHKFDEANGGEKYYAKYDRRHDISLVGIYKLSDKITLSGTWVYGTGNAISLPNAEYEAELDYSTNNYYNWIGDYRVNSYGDKNSYRMRAYHRLDLGIQFHKKKKRYERTWEIGIYNVYSRNNPFFYNIKTKDVKDELTGQYIGQKNVLEQISIFPIIPSITYNIKF